LYSSFLRALSLFLCSTRCWTSGCCTSFLVWFLSPIHFGGLLVYSQTSFVVNCTPTGTLSGVAGALSSAIRSNSRELVEILVFSCGTGSS
jgi:hypothetical protein